MSFKFIQEALNKLGVERLIGNGGENKVLNFGIYLMSFSGLPSFPFNQA